MMKNFWALFTVVLTLSSCYKEDIQDLYGRQYVIPSLTAWRDSVNNRLKELHLGLMAISKREPVSDLEYVVEKGDTLGVKITLGIKTVFVPYGKKGKDGRDGKGGRDGQAYEITMGENGHWFVNGEDTGKSWRGVKGEKGDQGDSGKDGLNGRDGQGRDGKDGKNGLDGKDGEDGKNGNTPFFGIKQAEDGHFYWTVTWPGEVETFLLNAQGKRMRANGQSGAAGPQGPQGPQGAPGYAGNKGWAGEQGGSGAPGPRGPEGSPGINSPLREVTENDTAYVFKVEYPGKRIVTYTILKQKDVKIPDETPLEIECKPEDRDMEGRSFILVVFKTDPGALVGYQVEGEEEETDFANPNGRLEVKVYTDTPRFNAHFISAWAQDIIEEKDTSPVKFGKLARFWDDALPS